MARSTRQSAIHEQLDLGDIDWENFSGLRLSAYLYHPPSGSSRLAGDQLGSGLENVLERMVPGAERVLRHAPLGSMREVIMVPTGTGGCGITDAIRKEKKEKGTVFPCTKNRTRGRDQPITR